MLLTVCHISRLRDLEISSQAVVRDVSMGNIDYWIRVLITILVASIIDIHCQV